MPGSGARAFPVRQTSCRLGSESVVALMRIGAYMVATTLTVVSCLHRHASLDSMREVETVQPLVFAFFVHPHRFSAGHPMVRRCQQAATELVSRSGHEPSGGLVSMPDPGIDHSPAIPASRLEPEG